METLTDIEKNNRTNIIQNLRNSITEAVDNKVIINSIPAKNEILLLGECTHGTYEFYNMRSCITKNMITDKGYRIILIEAEWPDIYRVNKYIHEQGDDKTAKESLKEIIKFPLWMWNNKITYELIEWLKDYNMKNKNDPVYIFGIDCQQFIKSRKMLIDFLYKTDRKYYELIRNQTEILSKFSNEQEYANQVVNGCLKQFSNAIPALLQGLLSTYQWDHVEKYLDKAKKEGVDPIEIISSEQNLEILVNGEEYFRKMLEEPPGSQASWNTRDQHMLMTIMRMRNRFQYMSEDKIIPKIIVWAHNSHIGNSNATNRGGKGFEQNNTWNVGQMVKEMFPDSYAIGFYTDNGTVYAGKKDTRLGEIHKLNSAHMYSYENIFHSLSEKYNIPKFKVDLTKFKLNNAKRIMSEDIINRPIPAKYRRIDTGIVFTAVDRLIDNRGIIKLKDTSNNLIIEYVEYGSISVRCVPVDYIIPENTSDFLNCNLLQRWIGINYVKETELDSHYGESCLIHQYDSIVYVDTTTSIV